MLFAVWGDDVGLGEVVGLGGAAGSQGNLEGMRKKMMKGKGTKGGREREVERKGEREKEKREREGEGDRERERELAGGLLL